MHIHLWACRKGCQPRTSLERWDPTHHGQKEKNQLQPNPEQKVVKFLQEAVPTFEDAEKLFCAGEKAKNRAKRTISWHMENIHVFKKALREHDIELA